MKFRVLACSVLLASSSVAFAGDDEVTLNLGVGTMFFDDDRNLDNGTLGAVGLEYGFTEKIAAEISYLQTSPSLDQGDAHADVREARIDGLYYLLSEGRWRPYVAAGLGSGKFDYDVGSFRENQVNVGGGIRFIANEVLSLRADLRGIRGDEDSDNDAALTLGMSWTFGDGNSYGKKPTPKSVTPPPVRMPEPVQQSEPVIKPQPVVEKAKPVVVAEPVVKDTDGDGVIDSKDQCPNTLKGVKVGSSGCEIKKVTVDTIQLDIKFPTNSSEVRAQYSSELKKVADFLSKHKDLVVDIEGHSDSRGKASYNKLLSQRRANAVKNAIVNQFSIDEKRINAIGYGEEKPVATNDTADGRQKNRRVIAVLQKEVVE